MLTVYTKKEINELQNPRRLKYVPRPTKWCEFCQRKIRFEKNVMLNYISLFSVPLTSKGMPRNIKYVYFAPTIRKKLRHTTLLK